MMIENNILLYYTTLETAEKILRTKKIRMSLLKDSKDTFEAELPAYHYSKNGMSAYNADDLQIVCFSKGTFPSTSQPNLTEYDKTKYSLAVPAMFNAYADFGEGMCFLLDRILFEKDNKLEKREIKYVKYPFLELNKVYDEYKLNNNPCIYYDMFKYKHSSFSYENEYRYFKKCQGEEFVDISNSLIGICRGPRLSNRSCKKLKEISTLIAFDYLVLKRIVDEKIRLFFCGELNGKFELLRGGLWEYFPAIEIKGQFPYRVCSTLECNNNNTWYINIQNKGMLPIKIVDGKIIPFHNIIGTEELWIDSKIQ
jgi:hypothetical protein